MNGIMSKLHVTMSGPKPHVNLQTSAVIHLPATRSGETLAADSNNPSSEFVYCGTIRIGSRKNPSSEDPLNDSASASVQTITGVEGLQMSLFDELVGPSIAAVRMEVFMQMSMAGLSTTVREVTLTSTDVARIERLLAEHHLATDAEDVLRSPSTAESA